MSSTRAELVGSVAELVIAHPPLNLFDLDTIAEVEQALAEISAWAQDGTCRALVMRAEGKVFCGGVDVHIFQGVSAPDGVALMGRCLALTQSIEALTVPSIAVVHALNLTIGFELSLGCDLIWAAPKVKFGLVEATVGLTPGAGGTQRLVSRAGIARAAELVLTGGLYEAEELNHWGVVNRIVPSDELVEAARVFAKQLANGPTIASGVAKQILLAARDHGVAAADNMTPSAVGPLLATDDLAHGVESLLANGPGKATFVGR